MPKIESYKQGTPSWIDYGAPDQESAKVFYSALFGWSYEENPMDMAGDGNIQFYSMGKKGDSYTGAIYTQNSEEANMGIPPHWKVYLTVDDIEASTAKASELGGNLLAGPFDVFEAGRMSVIMDPSGAVIHLWQAVNHIGAGVKDEHGAMVWAELLTTDQDAATEFYSKLLGVDLDDSMPSPDGGKYIVFMTGKDEGVAGCMTMPQHLQDMNIPSHWDVYFQVDDLDAIVELAASKGGDVKVAPMHIPSVGRIAYVMDPQGAGFGLITPDPM